MKKSPIHTFVYTHIACLALGLGGCDGSLFLDDGPDGPDPSVADMGAGDAHVPPAPPPGQRDMDRDPGDGGERDMPAINEPDMPAINEPDMPLPLPSTEFAIATRSKLMWKRQAQLTGDLARALDLNQGEVCTELGQAPCLAIHLVPLGGNDPFGQGMHEPVEEPLATTPAVVDRVVLSACERASQRVPNGAQAVEGEEAIITDLYRRLLARDPLSEEIAILSALTSGQGAATTRRQFYTLSCYAIGTSTEFVLY